LFIVSIIRRECIFKCFVDDELTIDNKTIEYLFKSLFVSKIIDSENYTYYNKLDVLG
jgi:hypothetical protein